MRTFHDDALRCLVPHELVQLFRCFLLLSWRKGQYLRVQPRCRVLAGSRVNDYRLDYWFCQFECLIERSDNSLFLFGEHLVSSLL